MNDKTADKIKKIGLFESALKEGYADFKEPYTIEGTEEYERNLNTAISALQKAQMYIDGGKEEYMLDDDVSERIGRVIEEIEELLMKLDDPDM